MFISKVIRLHPLLRRTNRLFTPISTSFPFSNTTTSIMASTTSSIPTSGFSIGTHNGHFHADEALAVYMLRLLPEYKTSSLTRSRDPAVLAKCHTVVDVGGVYDLSLFRFDHHQREFNTKFPGKDATKLSSAGLVYLHFGKRLIAQLTGLDESNGKVEILFQHLYLTFIEAFDANDNGVSAYDQTILEAAGIKSRFKEGTFSIAGCVNNFNHAGPLASILIPDFVATEGWDKPGCQDLEDALFGHASKFVGTQFLLAVQSAYKAWLPARSVVRSVYEQRTNLHASGKIIELPYSKDGLPWAEHLYTIEAETKAAAAGSADTPLADGYDSAAAERKTKRAKPEINDVSSEVLYAIFPESDAADCKWRIRAVGEQGMDFVNRKDLPNEWKGVRDADLEKVSGVEGAIFIHASGFIGGAKTRAGVLEMAQKAVDMI